MAHGAEAADVAHARADGHGIVPEALPAIVVGQMHLHAGNAAAGDGVAQGVAVVGQRAGIDDQPVVMLEMGLLNPVDELALGIGLKAGEHVALLGGHGLQVVDHRVEGGLAERVNLLGSRHVDAGAV